MLAVAGGVVGLIMVRRYKDWAMIVLAGLVGALLVMRGLTILLPTMQGISGTLIVIVLAGLSIAFQGGIFGKRKAARGGASCTGEAHDGKDDGTAPPTATK